MSRYGKTLRGKAAQALATSRKTIKRNGYKVKDDLTLMDVIFTFAMADGECSYCGKVTDDYQMEHIVSLAKNGPNTLSNICVSCKPCNLSKSSKGLLQWREYDEVVDVIQKMAGRRGVTIEEVLEDFTT
ncbi:HNH endonuclease [Bacillus massilinigeriensis]|uniref:HNH endonuclease n=1 Tax=Bacillus mediterraneensis TaxID=1805474 RepID=UPI00114D46F6|nr:HNH endonuclease signature motif containing protein [Bacillus mediterraneensis]